MMKLARGLAICYTTSDFTKRLAELPKDEVLKRILDQLDQVFSKLEARHMTATTVSDDDRAALTRLKKPSDAYLGGMFWDWNAHHYPYISGGYCSPRVGKNTESIKVMAEPYSHTDQGTDADIHQTKRLFFAGEAYECYCRGHCPRSDGIRRASCCASSEEHNA